MYFQRIQRLHVLTPEELDTLLDGAMADELLESWQAEELRWADAVVRGRRNDEQDLSSDQPTHPDLLGKVDGETTIGGPPDSLGCSPVAPNADHGTRVAALPGAATNNMEGIAAVGYNARLRLVDAGVQRDPDCGVAGWVPGFMELVDSGVQVINLSFGRCVDPAEDDYGPGRDAIRYASNRGVVVVTSAGNSGTACSQAGPDGLHYPSAAVEAVGVSHLGDNGFKHQSSSFGPWVDIAAPGESILTACDPEAANGAFYCEATGTSLSSPLVAGGMALMAGRWDQRDQSYEPGLRLVNRLLDAAGDAPPNEPEEHYGQGLLNLRAAMTDRVVRLGGNERLETSQIIAREAFPASNVSDNPRVADRIVLIPSDSTDQGIEVGWKSALPSAGLLGYRGERTAMILTRRDAFSETARTEIDRLANLLVEDGPDSSTTDVGLVIAGSPQVSISQGLQEEVQQKLPRSTRLYGIGSPESSVHAADATAMADQISSESPGTEVLVVSEGAPDAADKYADAIAMAAVAADRALPMLFVEQNRVPPITCGWLQGHQEIATIHLAGGEAAASEGVRQELASCAGVPLDQVRRHGGVTRIETSNVIARAFFADPEGVALATGYDWVDAVTGSNLSRSYGAPILLTDGMSTSIEGEHADYINDAQAVDPVLDGWIIGGEAVVTSSLEQDFEGLLPTRPGSP